MNTPDDEQGKHIPGVPMCPDCGVHYTHEPPRPGDRKHWIAQCDCMALRFERFLAAHDV